MRRLTILGLSLVVVVAAFAAEPPRVKPRSLPDWFPNPGLFEPTELGTYDYEEDTFIIDTPKPNDPHHVDHVTVRGRYWRSNLFTRKTFGKRWRDEGPGVSKRLDQQLLGEGFRHLFLREDPANFRATYKRGEGDGATWLEVDLAFHGEGGSMHAVEVAPNPFSIALKPPAPAPETFSDKENFPYLTPPPAEKLTQTTHFDRPLSFAPAPTGPHVPVGSGYIKKEYSEDPTLSELAFHDAYMTALRKAGWTITADTPHGGGTIYAHYDKNGRDLYAYLNGRFHNIWVADVGSELESALRKSCKAALYGINFDFDKATLRPDSDPTLQQVLKLMKDEPKLALEIGGHTDNVGKPDYNISLSDRRAAAVKEWLDAHGIAASRLSSRGYGDTQPLVPNNSDENRAINRRVELKKEGCR